MIKIVFFDLDNTLAPVGLPSSDTVVSLLRLLAQTGVRIAVCSGKPVSYLNGYARQVGIADMIMLGENGATYQFGTGLPPEESGCFGDSDAWERLADISAGFRRAFAGKCWYQKNELAFTPFPYKDEYFPEMREYFNSTVPETGLRVYEHPDCFDILPEGISKGSAVRFVCSRLGIDPCDTVSVGDHSNDYPMFEATGLALGINLADAEKANRNFPNIEEALGFILSLVNTLPNNR